MKNFFRKISFNFTFMIMGYMAKKYISRIKNMQNNQIASELKKNGLEVVEDFAINRAHLTLFEILRQIKEFVAYALKLQKNDFKNFKIKKDIFKNLSNKEWQEIEAKIKNNGLDEEYYQNIAELNEAFAGFKDELVDIYKVNDQEHFRNRLIYIKLAICTLTTAILQLELQITEQMKPMIHETLNRFLVITDLSLVALEMTLTDKALFKYVKDLFEDTLGAAIDKAIRKNIAKRHTEQHIHDANIAILTEPDVETALREEDKPNFTMVKSLEELNIIKENLTEIMQMMIEHTHKLKNNIEKKFFD